MFDSGNPNSRQIKERNSLVEQNPYEAPTDTELPDTASREPFRWKPLLYRTLQIVSFVFAGLVVLAVVAMISEYLGAGQGAASSFGKLTGWVVLANILMWTVPVVISLWLIHLKRVRNYFIEN